MGEQNDSDPSKLEEGQPGSPAARQPGSPAARQEVSGPNWKNRTLFHGDNLPFLQAMDSETVDLIATDPPFNKSKDFHATPNKLARGAKFQDRWRWEDPVHQEWKDKLTDNHPRLMEAIESARFAHSDSMGAYLCFMAVRLLEMHRVLKATGSIYLHCDPTASHYLKAGMDAIFGWKQFRNQIIWRRTGSHNSAKRFGPIHDVILFYAMPEYRHNVHHTPYLAGHVRDYFKKNDKRGRYWTNSIHGDGIRHGVSGKPWRGFNPTDHGRHWAVPSELVSALGIDEDLPQHDKLDALYKLGVIDTDTDYLPTYRQYLVDSPGQPLQDLWVYQPHTKGTLHESAEEIDRDVRWIPKRDKKERVGYPTQKPIGLYSRIILSSTSPGDVVLDPFAGCATTLVAAERNGRQWAGIDIWDNAEAVVIERMKRERLALPEAARGDLFTRAILWTTELPERRDDGEIAVEPFETPERRSLPKEPWQRMGRKAMFDALAAAQSITEGLVLCAGCGRELEAPFMELDHIVPRSDRGVNDISNRIVLCRPCNGRKSANLTMGGLFRANKKAGWMRDEKRALRARDLAHDCYEDIRYRRTWPATTGDLFN